MYPIKEFKFDKLPDELALNYIAIHNEIYKKIQSLNNDLIEEPSKNYLNVFLSKYHLLKDEPKLVSNTIICSTINKIKDLDREINNTPALSNNNLGKFKDEDYYQVLVSNLKKKKRVISDQTQVHLNEVILSVFNYEGRRKNLLEYYASKNYGVCLYCLAQFTSIYRSSKENEYYLKGNLDHIIPKTKNPYLSISLNNLIPVCGHCNQRKATTSFKYDPFNLDHKHEFDFSGCLDIDENAEIVLTSLDNLIIKTKKANFADISTKLNYKNLYKNFEENAEIMVTRFKKFYSDGYETNLSTLTDESNSKTRIEYFVSEIPLTEENILKHPLVKFKIDLFDSIKDRSKR